jgi:diadenosine tetraphosphatase ApaH/serine/threonine PP2A family protein phosphatase
MVHASLDGPEHWPYVCDKLSAAANFSYQNTTVCFYGHTHLPMAFTRDIIVRGGTYSKIKIEQGRKYFVNVGSVGEPRDGNPAAAYVLYDFSDASIELRRVDYNREETEFKTLAAGLMLGRRTPNGLATQAGG